MRLSNTTSGQSPTRTDDKRTPCRGCVYFSDSCPWLASVDQEVGCVQFIANFEAGDAEGIKDHDIAHL